MARDTMGFWWKLIAVTDPTTETKIQFTPLVPSPALFVGWDFGDGFNNLTDSIATHTFTTLDTFDVDYNYTLRTVPNTKTRPVVAISSAFFERIDTNTLVTYTRIFRSAFLFPTNDTLTHSSMRFEWTIDGEVLTDAEYKLPNIRYNFETSGIHNVTLSVWNTADPLKISTYTIPVNIQPNLASKVEFQNVPNVFTPNGDGIFDNFIVRTSGTSRILFKVFTRTGVLVYQNEAYYLSWDGKNNNGKDVPEGVYYYIIEDIDKQYEDAKGFVYIFRGNK